MDEIEKRLRDASDSCVSNYLEWRKSERESETRERLQDSIHELRKVASRLEIEMAISEREEMAQRPIPIPPHRSKRERNGQSQQAQGYDEDMVGNMDPGPRVQRGGPQIRRSRRRSPSSDNAGNE
ncbi:MAG: hypothetical protein EOM26_04675 [Alphaproteobacteria bacterium]|nr:hypothetical protein [Alphaproteobacteria bacterium]